MDTKSQKLPTPPYVPFKTFKNFLEKFKQGVPARIDRDSMGSMSGASQSQVTTALKYLGLISENNLPQEPLKQFVVAEGEQQKHLLAAMLKRGYPFIFGATFDLATATPSLLREAFEENTSATGETVGRCIGFFKEAATNAGIAVSPYITQKKPRNGGQRKRTVQIKKADGAKEQPTHTGRTERHIEHIEAESSLLLWGLFQRLPKPGSIWPLEQRNQWTQTLQNVLALEYKEPL